MEYQMVMLDENVKFRLEALIGQHCLYENFEAFFKQADKVKSGELLYKNDLFNWYSFEGLSFNEFMTIKTIANIFGCKSGDCFVEMYNEFMEKNNIQTIEQFKNALGPYLTGDKKLEMPRTALLCLIRERLFDRFEGSIDARSLVEFCEELDMEIKKKFRIEYK